jgi:hypothetical protein
MVHSAQGLVAGCPPKYTLLHSTPYSDNNFFLFGHSAVVTDAYKRKEGTNASKAFSFLCPGPWYAINQTYIPYNLEGLDGKAIIKEVLQSIPSDYAEAGETDRLYRRRVWKLLVDMHGDQKWYSLRFGSWLLTLIFKWLFNGELFVNLSVSSKLRELAPKSTFVYATISTPCLYCHICISSLCLAACTSDVHISCVLLQIRANTQEPPGLSHAQLCAIFRRPCLPPYRCRCAAAWFYIVFCFSPLTAASTF